MGTHETGKFTGRFNSLDTGKQEKRGGETDKDRKWKVTHKT